MVGILCYLYSGQGRFFKPPSDDRVRCSLFRSFGVLCIILIIACLQWGMRWGKEEEDQNRVASLSLTHTHNSLSHISTPSFYSHHFSPFFLFPSLFLIVCLFLPLPPPSSLFVIGFFSFTFCSLLIASVLRSPIEFLKYIYTSYSFRCECDIRK